ncbi:MAG: HEAT repeat domain-containing protein [Planctomycetes bacterium]|nr:HEAT repeat domain-containing protein [Planctomycetota bacterium]
MTLVASLLCLCTTAPLPQGDLRLPPPSPASRTAPAPAPVQRPLSEVERFRRDLPDLQGPQPKVEAKLQEMGQAYPVMEPLILEVARTARANEMANLMVVARRFGAAGSSARVGDELLFQLLARPLGDATRPVVDTMVVLKGGDAKRALQECVRGRIGPARRAAMDVLVTFATADDLHFALQLSGEQTLDLQLRGVDLLAAVPDDRARERLVELLSKDPALAGAACEALVRLGSAAVPHLQRLCAAPAIDRGYCYAAFALAQIEQATGQPVVPDAAAPLLQRRLAERDPLTRSLAAVPLADLAWRGVDTGVDREVVDALIDVTAPVQFVPNLDLLRRPAEERLLRLTGRLLAGTGVLPWREWWQHQRETFVGARAEVGVEGDAAAFAAVTLQEPNRVVRVLAEGLADAAPVAGATEVLLTAPQMLALCGELRARGFGDPERMRVASSLPAVRSLQVQVPKGRAQVAVPAGENLAFDGLVQVVEEQLAAQLWQVYRDPAVEPDRAAFWRAERRWLEANPDPVEQGRRFARRLVQQWATLTPQLRARGVEQLLRHPQRRELIGEEDGGRIVEALRARPHLEAIDLNLLELAAGAPGDRVWRDCVALAATATGGGRPAVRAVFAVLGPDAVLQALDDTDPVVRRAAIEESTVLRDLRAGPRLVALLADADPGVAFAAAVACGQLQLADAADRIVQTIAADGTPPALRRECLRALGRIGGDRAFAVLQRALTAPQQEDKEAALRGLGELRDPRAAHLLADLAVIAHGKDLGALARHYLQRLGGTLAVPALRAQLQVVQDPAVRDELVLLLGAYQDAASVPDLMDLLRDPKHGVSAAGLLSAATGVDLLNAEDRTGVIEVWYRRNRNQPQWQWLLDGLAAAQEPTTLRAEQFAASAGLVAVPELARVLTEGRTPRLRVLAAAVLRTLTNEDFGVVAPDTPADVREGIAARYRLLAESARAAQGR